MCGSKVGETMEENQINQAEEIRNFRRRRKKQSNKKTIAILAVVVLISLFNIFFGIDSAKKDINITIESGKSTVEIAKLLEEEGVISKKIKFIFTVLFTGNKGNLKFGTFEIEKGMSHGEIVELFSKEGAKKATVKLAIPEGYSVENIKARMIELGLGDENSIEEALKANYSYEFISKIPQKEGVKYKLQGFLFPSTYEFYADAKPYDVIDRLLGEFEKQYNSVADGYDGIFEVITKASVIEREAKIDSERKTIAGVFENRLKKNMKLQVDATVAYVVSDGLYNVNRILYRHLEEKSPYNTYYVEGLPVGPICSPGIESIKAALNPEKHEYLYYHTDEEKNDGSHIFTKNFNEHKQTMN